VRFIDEHRDRFGGVEPICRVLRQHGCQIAPSGYWAAKARRPSARQVRDEQLLALSRHRTFLAGHHIRQVGPETPLDSVPGCQDENCRMVVELNVLPGPSTVPGKSRSFGEFGKCCVSKV
jgi:hypothetical protein